MLGLKLNHVSKRGHWLQKLRSICIAMKVESNENMSNLLTMNIDEEIEYFFMYHIKMSRLPAIKCTQ